MFSKETSEVNDSARESRHSRLMGREHGGRSPNLPLAGESHDIVRFGSRLPSGVWHEKEGR